MIKITSLALVALLSLNVAAEAVNVGDPAPPLNLSTWLNGSPVNPADSDGQTVYVVEFWATWCGPCRRSIPHLNELQAMFKNQNVVIIGISHEDADKVKSFMEKTPMEYHVAVDPKRTTGDTYMAGVRGIPHAIVIDKKGRVVWKGHPMDGLDKAIERALWSS